MPFDASLRHTSVNILFTLVKYRSSAATIKQTGVTQTVPSRAGIALSDPSSDSVGCQVGSAPIQTESL